MKKEVPLLSRILLKESVFLYASAYSLTFFRFLTGFLVARFLGPSLYGLRTLFGLVVEYAEFLHLGTFDAMRKEVPYYHGKNDKEFAQIIQNNVFSVNLGFSLIVCLVLVGFAVYSHAKHADQVYIDFLLFLALFQIIQKVRMFYTAKLIADKRVDEVSKARVIEGLSYTAACVSLTFFFSLRGLFVGLLISSLIVLSFLATRVRAIPRMEISPRILWGLLKVGFPIMLIAFMFVAMRSIDRIMIAALLTKEMLGYFAIGTIVSGLIFFSIADVMAGVFAPRIMEKIGLTGNVDDIRNYFVEPTILVAYGVPLLIGAIVLGIHVPIKYFLPEYGPSVLVVQILCLGAYFISIALMPLMICVALNRQSMLVLLVFLVCVINAVLSYLCIVLGFGIAGVAVGTSISYFALSLMSLWYAWSRFDFRLSESAKLVSLVFAPFVYMVILVYTIDNLGIWNAGSIGKDVLYTGAKTFGYFLAYSFIFIPVRNNTAFRKLFGILPILPWKGRIRP